jgi:glycosyltransferase involved in cell wall biosynthesis
LKTTSFFQLRSAVADLQQAARGPRESSGERHFAKSCESSLLQRRVPSTIDCDWPAITYWRYTLSAPSNAADMTSNPLSLAYSIADQNFDRTKSIGILNLSLQLVEALAPRTDFEKLEVFSNSSLRNWHGRLAGRPVHCYDRACDTRLGRIIWDQRQAYVEADRHRVTWLFLPKGFASFWRRPRMKLATYVHDVIGEHYNQRYPNAVSRAEAWYFRQSLLAVVKDSTVIFTNSDFSRRELLAFSDKYAIRPPEIVVAGMGFGAAPIPSRDRRAIVVLASKWPHKRTDLAMDYMTAWQRATDFAGEVHWVGRFPPGLQRTSHPRWTYHGRLDEAAYESLIAGSVALVYFSEYEGFGMPPVEAVLSGVCPVYSALPATHEVMGGAGAPFENASCDSFIAAMNKALHMQPWELAASAQHLRRQHNWPAVADRVVAALKTHS